jgi:hypothetical protein
MNVFLPHNLWLWSGYILVFYFTRWLRPSCRCWRICVSLHATPATGILPGPWEIRSGSLSAGELCGQTSVQLCALFSGTEKLHRFECSHSVLGFIHFHPFIYLLSIFIFTCISLCSSWNGPHCKVEGRCSKPCMCTLRNCLRNTVL